MATLKTSPEANCDRPTGRPTDRMTKPLIGARATALPKNNNGTEIFFDSICLLLWCQMTDLQCCLVYNSIFSHDVRYFQKFLGAKASLGLVRVGK